MRTLFLSFVFMMMSLAAASAAAQSVVVYQDDFEGAVTGWSVNNTDFDPDVTRFLGRFDNNPNSTSRTFNIPASSDRVEIVFDFYRFDSWDDTARWGFDRFEIDIDGIEIFSLPFPNPQATRSGTTGNVDWSHSPLTPRQELAFGTGRFWFDQLHRVEIVVNNPGSTLQLTLRTDVNQGGNDESGGFDNMTVTAFPTLPVVSFAKTVATPSYSLPGSDVDYTLTMTNTGGETDVNSVFLLDEIPEQLILFTGDVDGSGNPVEFIDNSALPSGLTCCTAANIEYSNTVGAAPIFGYTPVAPYDAAITFLRITPSGVVRDGQTSPVDVSFRFRARIR
ncbi:MAG: hypothetical protein AAF004_04405 [Pseudomonadota bacterium]